MIYEILILNEKEYLNLSKYSKFEDRIDFFPCRVAYDKNENVFYIPNNTKTPIEKHKLAEMILLHVKEENYTHTRGGLGKYVKIFDEWYLHNGNVWVKSCNQSDKFIPKEVSNQKYEIFDFYKAIKTHKDGENVEYFDNGSWKLADFKNKPVVDFYNHEYWRVHTPTFMIDGIKFNKPMSVDEFKNYDGVAYAIFVGIEIKMVTQKIDLFYNLAKHGLVFKEYSDAEKYHNYLMARLISDLG